MKNLLAAAFFLNVFNVNAELCSKGDAGIKGEAIQLIRPSKDHKKLELVEDVRIEYRMKYNL